MLPEVLRDAEVADDVLALRPDYRALLLVVEDISPGPGDDASEALLLRAESTAIALTAGAPVEELPTSLRGVTPTAPSAPSRSARAAASRRSPGGPPRACHGSPGPRTSTTR